MIRGTTPLHTFATDVDLRGHTVYVTYKQNGVTVIEKTNKDLVITESGFVVMLTQAETLRFIKDKPVQMQIRYVTKEGISEASNIIETTVDNVLKNGVIK